MRRFLAITALIVGLVTPLAGAAGSVAAITLPCPAPKSGVCQDAQQGANESNPVISVIAATIGILSYIIGAAAIIGIVVSGLRFILANGDSSSVASARSGLVYSLIGVVIAAAAQSIVVFVLDKIK